MWHWSGPWHWLIWLMPPWGRNARRRAVLVQVKRWQKQERERAFGRIEYRNRGWNGPMQGGPTWDGPTRMNSAVLPLLTPGQAARSNDADRRHNGNHRNDGGS